MPMVRSAVDAKKLFSLSGCIVIRCGLGCRIRWINFYTSFGFLDDNILSMKFLLVDLIVSLRRLRAARNFSQDTLLLLLVLAADRRRSLYSLSSAMVGSLSHVTVQVVEWPSLILMVHTYRYIPWSMNLIFRAFHPDRRLQKRLQMVVF